MCIKTIPLGANPQTYHGMKDTPMYERWKSMKARCFYPSNKSYYLYGGRGIKVCERWRRSFRSFYEDVGDPPGPEYTLDRIDNNGDYAPGNTRWVTQREQNINRRIRKDNKTGIAGLQWQPKKKTWRVTFAGKRLGSRVDFFEACCLRKSAEAAHNKKLREAGLL